MMQKLALTTRKLMPSQSLSNNYFGEKPLPSSVAEHDITWYEIPLGRCGLAVPTMSSPSLLRTLSLLAGVAE